MVPCGAQVTLVLGSSTQGAFPGAGQAGIPRACRPPAQPPHPLCTEAPSWLWFSPCFSNYAEWARNSSSGALFGSYHHRPGGLLLPSFQPSQRLALCGTCPCCFDFCPHVVLIASGFWVVCHPPHPPPCLGPDRPGQVARGGGQAVWGGFSVPHPGLSS